MAEFDNGPKKTSWEALRQLQKEEDRLTPYHPEAARFSSRAAFFIREALEKKGALEVDDEKERDLRNAVGFRHKLINRELSVKLKHETERTIEELSEFFKLGDRHTLCPPRIIYSSLLDTFEYDYYGVDEGYYARHGSSFNVKVGPSGRDDPRLMVLGPTIFYNGNVTQDTVVEECLHYLEWIHRQEDDFLRDLKLSREHGFWQTLHFPDSSADAAGIVTEASVRPRPDKEMQASHILASKILSEASAELYRCFTREDLAGADYHFHQRWVERGILGLITREEDRKEEEKAALGYRRQTSFVDTLCKEGFEEAMQCVLIWSGCSSIEEAIEKFQPGLRRTAGIETHYRFPQDLVHFAGEVLGRELARVIHDEEVFRQITLSLFSQKAPAIERLEALLDYVETSDELGKKRLT